MSVLGLIINLIGLVFFHEFSHGGGECSHGGHSHSHGHSHGDKPCQGHGSKSKKIEIQVLDEDSDSDLEGESELEESPVSSIRTATFSEVYIKDENSNDDESTEFP